MRRDAPRAVVPRDVSRAVLPRVTVRRDGPRAVVPPEPGHAGAGQPADGRSRSQSEASGG
ncbi:MAG: hypothetical protein ACJ8AI_11175 [Rhodopila sp.]